MSQNVMINRRKKELNVSLKGKQHRKKLLAPILIINQNILNEL